MTAAVGAGIFPAGRFSKVAGVGKGPALLRGYNGDRAADDQVFRHERIVALFLPPPARHSSGIASRGCATIVAHHEQPVSRHDDVEPDSRRLRWYRRLP